MGLKVQGPQVSFDAPSSTVSVAGMAPDQATREKVLLCCGNVAQASSVKNLMTVAKSSAESRMHAVASGDSLSKISPQFYGTPKKCLQIFEVNKPMLSDPEKIHPGQVLRIPPDA